MQLIFGRDNAEQLKERYTVLELAGSTTIGKLDQTTQ